MHERRVSELTFRMLCQEGSSCKFATKICWDMFPQSQTLRQTLKHRSDHVFKPNCSITPGTLSFQTDALMYVFSYLCSHVSSNACSHRCALMCVCSSVLPYVCSHVCAFLCRPTCTLGCCHMAARLILCPFPPSTHQGKDSVWGLFPG